MDLRKMWKSVGLDRKEKKIEVSQREKGVQREREGKKREYE